jgi:hypothetical protein
MESLKQLYSLAMDAYLGCSVIHGVTEPWGCFENLQDSPTIPYV